MTVGSQLTVSPCTEYGLPTSSDDEVILGLIQLAYARGFRDRKLSFTPAELFRVLKCDKYCAILIGDTRRGRHFVPLAFNVMKRFLKVGFVLKEDIVKVQHNCTMTQRWRAKARQGGFYLIMHEHLFVFRKPKENEDLSRIRYSCG